MKDPIDWPAMGMPERVEVVYTHNERHEWEACTPCREWVGIQTDHRNHMVVALWAGDLVSPTSFPILRAFMRAAEAIEKGEVKL